MTRYRLHCITGLMLMLLTATAAATVTLPRILGNNMVLQQHQPVPVWGFAAVGEAVTVSFKGQRLSAVADASGHWQILLQPMKADASPAELVIAGTNRIVLKNILVGEVWLCSGQSNMEYTMRKNSKVVKTDSSADSPIDELQRARNPAIRIFLVTSRNLRTADSTHSGWSVARDSALRSFSAAGYFFAKELYSKLQVPIGVISSAVPGSAIEPWMTGSVTRVTITYSGKGAGPGSLPILDTSKPGKFVPTMIRPLAPFAIKGFLWYQGETNCFQNEREFYTQKMILLIRGWRQLWGSTEMPFYFVGIAPFYYSKTKNEYPLTAETLPWFWVSQYQVMQQVPHTGMVVTTDLVRTPDDLHPGYKWEVGRRLAQWPLANEYGKGVVPSGPLMNEVKHLRGRIELDFQYAGAGLVSKDGKPLNWFEVAGIDGVWSPADATIKGNSVLVSSPKVPDPVYVRFAWNEAAQPNLFNRNGLPAMPFNTMAGLAKTSLDRIPAIRSEDLKLPL